MLSELQVILTFFDQVSPKLGLKFLLKSSKLLKCRFSSFIISLKNQKHLQWPLVYFSDPLPKSILAHFRKKSIQQQQHSWKSINNPVSAPFCPFCRYFGAIFFRKNRIIKLYRTEVAFKSANQSNQPISSVLSVHNGSNYMLHTENDSSENRNSLLTWTFKVMSKWVPIEYPPSICLEFFCRIT